MRSTGPFLPMRRRRRSRSHCAAAALRRLAPAVLLLSAAAGCATVESWSNPLIGRWTADAPFGGFSLGTYEFKPDSVNALGFEQEVDYTVNGDRVEVRPRGFGPQFEVTMVDSNTARLGSPLTGDLVTLHRVR
jgi:hypothetical protein